MTYYAGWRARLIASRPRAVTCGAPIKKDPKWITNATDIEALLEKARQGDDLTPYLSSKVVTQGFTPASQAQGASIEDRWSDKDLILNVTGYYHFHLQPAPARTNDLLLARVTRSEFTPVGVFDHGIFDATLERDRLFTMFYKHLGRGLAPGTVVATLGLTTSGFSTPSVLFAQSCYRCVRAIDKQLDDSGYVESMLNKAGLQPSKNKKLSWAFSHLDFGLFHKASGTFLVLIFGPN